MFHTPWVSISALTLWKYYKFAGVFTIVFGIHCNFNVLLIQMKFM